MKIIAPIAAFILIVLVANSAFIVPEGQSALVLQFGRIQGAGSESADLKPGLHFKLPLIQQVVRYDRRILNLGCAAGAVLHGGEEEQSARLITSSGSIENPVTYYHVQRRRRDAEPGQQPPGADHQGCTALRIQFAHAARPDRERALGHHRARAQAGQRADARLARHPRSSTCASSASTLPEEVVRVRCTSACAPSAMRLPTRCAPKAARSGEDPRRRRSPGAGDQGRSRARRAKTRGEGDAKAAEIYAQRTGRIRSSMRSIAAWRPIAKR